MKSTGIYPLAGALWLLGVVSCRAGAASAEDDPRAVSTNRVVNGDFERADPEDPRRPEGWDLPDGLGIQWTVAPSGTDGVDRGKAIRMDTRVSEREMVASWRNAGLDQWDIPNASYGPVGATYGLSYYSVPIPSDGAPGYRISFDLHAAGPGAKVWVRGYAPGRDGALRRVYETVVHCRPEPMVWQREERVFYPSGARPGIREFRIMLYATWPGGIYWFDTIRLEPVSPADLAGETVP